MFGVFGSCMSVCKIARGELSEGAPGPARARLTVSDRMTVCVCSVLDAQL